WLLRKVGFNISLERVRDVVALAALPALLTTAISATIGTISLSLGGNVQWESFFSVWSVWWLGDAMGALVVAPLLLTWAAGRHPTARRTLESLLMFALLSAVGLLITLGPHPFSDSRFLIFPFMIWSAMRLGQRITGTAVVVVSGIAIWGAVHGTG